MDSLPKLTEDEEWLRPIPGAPPSLINRPTGCAFHPRCFLSQGRLRCREEDPPLRPIGRGTAHTSGLPLLGGADRSSLEVRPDAVSER